MYTLLVTREKEHQNVVDLKGRKENSTISSVKLLDKAQKVIWKGFCCENAGPSTDTPNQDKRIVAREYKLEWTATTKNSNKSLGKWQNKALLVTCDSILPNFRKRRILIHVGNYPTDTEGCLLFGVSQNGKGAVNSSVTAIKEFFDIVQKIGVENITLKIAEIA